MKFKNGMNFAVIPQTSQYKVSRFTCGENLRRIEKLTHLLHLDWHQQKINNPWLLPSLNSFLSKMDTTSWNLTPNNSNLVEGGHSGTNDITSIGKEIGKAVLRYFQIVLFVFHLIYYTLPALVNLTMKLPMNLRRWNGMPFYPSAGMGHPNGST